MESGEIQSAPAFENITDCTGYYKAFLRTGISALDQRKAKIPNVLVDPVRLRDVLVNIRVKQYRRDSSDGGRLKPGVRKGRDGYKYGHISDLVLA